MPGFFQALRRYAWGTPQSVQPQAAQISTGPLAPRVSKLPKEAKWLKKEMAQDAKDGVASMTHIVGHNAQMQIKGFDYGSGKAQEATVLKAPKDGTMDLTVLMSVSGHTKEADKFAQENVYNVRVTLPDGSKQTMGGIKANGEYCTAQNISFPLQQGTTKVEAWPDGSAGPYGYVEGRVINISYDGK